MSSQIVLEVTQPFHKSGTEVQFQPGERFPLGTDLPDGVSVREVIADVPDKPAKAEAKTEGKGAAK
jgi:hypothetical protein